MLGSSAGEGLVRSCDRRDRVRTWEPGEGVELLRAWFGGRAFTKHRHDTYAIGVTEAGVQTFFYRGRVERSTPGQVVVLHPDEVHDGRAGTEAGFGYRIVEVVTGLSRYELARQFRAAYGTSPYRYSLMRRLEFARTRLGCGSPVGEVALAAGFVDQAHFTRMFRLAFGVTPGRYGRLRCATA